MPQLLKVDFKDVNGAEASSSMWVESEEVSADVIVALKAASNAEITHITLSYPISVEELADNNAVAANVETVAQKAEVTYRGPIVGAGAKPYAFVNVGIPAPIGTLINGPGGDLSNSDLTGMAANIYSEDGTVMTTVQAVKYRR